MAALPDDSIDDSFVGIFDRRVSTSTWKGAGVSQGVMRSVARAEIGDEAEKMLYDGVDGDGQVRGELGFGLYSQRGQSVPWAMTLQLVKHESQYEVWVNGFMVDLAPLEEYNDVKTVQLLDHRGFVRDASDRVRTAAQVVVRDPAELRSEKTVFSPCCVSVLLEDGETSPESCKLSLIQRSTNFTGAAIYSSQLIDGVDLEPHRVSDVVAKSAITMFPTAYPKQGSVVIYDMYKVYRAQRKATNDILVTFGKEYFTILVAAVGASAATAGNPSQQEASGILGGAFKWFNEQATYIAGGIATDAGAAAGSLLNMVGLRPTFATPEAPTTENAAERAASFSARGIVRAVVEFSVRDIQTFLTAAAKAPGLTLEQVNAQRQAAGQPVFGSLTEFDSSRVIGGMKLLAVTALAFTALNAVPTTGFLSSIIASGAKTFATLNEIGWGPAIQAMALGLKKWLKAEPAPTPKRVAFSLTEFADTIDSLGSVMELTNKQLDTASKVQRFEREVVVFKWLQEDEEIPILPRTVGGAITGGLQRLGSERGLGKPNPADFSDLQPTALTSLLLRLEVSIKDKELCEGDFRIGFECFPTDNVARNEIAALAIGTLQQLDRILFSIEGFRRRITAIVERFKSGTFLRSETLRVAGARTREVLYTWNVMPVLNSLTNFVLGLARRTPEFRKQTAEQLGVTQGAAAQVILLRFNKKFDPGFLSPTSPVKLLRGRLLARLQRLELVVSPQAPPSEFYRMLPQTFSGYFTLAMQGSTSDSSGYVDTMEDQTTSVRQFSEMKDSIRMFNETARTAARIVRLRLSDLQRGRQRVSSVQFYRIEAGKEAQDTPIVELFGHSIDPVAVYNGLVMRTPTSIQTMKVSLTEPMQRRLALICSDSRDGAVLSKYGIEDSEMGLLGLTAFCDILCSELVKAYSKHLQGGVSKGFVLASVLSNSTRSAIERVRAVVEFIALTTKADDAGLMGGDLLVATRTTRDVRQVLAVLLQHTRYEEDQAIATEDGASDWSDDGWTPMAVQNLRDTANLLKKTMTSFSSEWQKAVKNGLEHQFLASIPNEPLQSLFHSREFGMFAHRRVRASVANSVLTGSWRQTLESFASAAYASNFLVAETQEPSVQMAMQAHFYDADDCESLRRQLLSRFAALRLDIDSYTQIDTVDGLTRAMATGASLTTSTLPNECIFFVPFAYGDPFPPLCNPVVSPCLFGSVPVWIEEVEYATSSILSQLAPSTTTTAVPVVSEAKTCRIAMHYARCEFSSRPVVDSNSDPHFITTVRNGKELVVTVRAVQIPLEIPNGWAAFNTSDYARGAADAIYSAYQYLPQFSSAVNSVGWNVERILQALILTRLECPDDPFEVLLDALYDEEVGAARDDGDAVDLTDDDAVIGFVRDRLNNDVRQPQRYAEVDRPGFAPYQRRTEMEAAVRRHFEGARNLVAYVRERFNPGWRQRMGRLIATGGIFEGVVADLDENAPPPTTFGGADDLAEVLIRTEDAASFTTDDILEWGQNATALVQTLKDTLLFSSVIAPNGILPDTIREVDVFGLEDDEENPGDPQVRDGFRELLEQAPEVESAVSLALEAYKRAMKAADDMLFAEAVQRSAARRQAIMGGAAALTVALAMAKQVLGKELPSAVRCVDLDASPGLKPAVQEFLGELTAGMQNAKRDGVAAFRLSEICGIIRTLLNGR